MKQRIKIDSSLLVFLVLVTFFLFSFPYMYPDSLLWDNILDALGLWIVLSGCFLRMVARGFKKEHSARSQALVCDGPYIAVRNPMYLGSLLMGAGFAVMVWPLWLVPVFVGLFYSRFKRQILWEEEYLLKTFGKAYEAYLVRVPRLWPSWLRFKILKWQELLPARVAFITKERHGLWSWPLLAAGLETLQEYCVFGFTDIRLIGIIFLATMGAFFIFIRGIYRHG